MKKLLLVLGLVFSLSLGTTLNTVHAQTISASDQVKIAQLQQILVGLIQQLNDLIASQKGGASQIGDTPFNQPAPSVPVPTLVGNQNWCVQSQLIEAAPLRCSASIINGNAGCAQYTREVVNLYQQYCQNPPTTQNQIKIMGLKKQLLQVRYSYATGNETTDQRAQEIQAQIDDLQLQDQS